MPEPGKTITRRTFLGVAAGAAGATTIVPTSASETRRGHLKLSHEVPVVAEYDVVVCGGGPSGCAAALAARREGLSVLLVEGQAQLGGMATSGLVSHWLGGRTQDGDWVVGGIFKTLVEEASSRGFATMPQLPKDRIYQPHAWLPWFIHGIPLDTYRVAYFLNEKVLMAGVDLLLETRVVAAEVRSRRMTHVVTHNKSGLQAVAATVVIDATGDADVADLSGCEVRVGRETDGLMTPASLTFHLYHVDHQALGVRETRRIQADFQMRVADLRQESEFADTVGFSMYGWDLPDVHKPSVQPLVDESTGRYINKVQKGLSTPIPYRIMVPRPVTNLLCPGRAVSVERDVLGPLRVMAPCMAMGEACGTAAAQIVRDRCAASDVDVLRLRARLRQAGAIVDQQALPVITPRQDP